VPEATSVPAPTLGEVGVRSARVAGLGAALPDRVVGNGPIATRVGVEESWIVARTGVLERRIAAPGERLADYATVAGARALADAGLAAEELELVLVATMSHEDLTPAASALVAAQLGATQAGALDVNAACTGFVAALTLAAGQIESGRAGNALVIGADLLSRITDPDDRGTAALLADGAGAMALLPSEEEAGIGPAVLGADGARADLIRASREEALVRMKGPDTFRQAVDRLSEATLDAVAAAGLGLEQIDLFVYHQANSRIIRAVGERLELPAERVIDTVPRFGNTSAASIPLALSEARRLGRLSGGERVLLAAFGGGLTWGAAVVDWGVRDAA
jgi:3-oxoacyl-[acyl-carrier-protein] synthase III